MPRMSIESLGKRHVGPDVIGPEVFEAGPQGHIVEVALVDAKGEKPRQIRGVGKQEWRYAWLVR